MKESSIFKKLSASIINVIISFILFIPFYFIIKDTFIQKVIFIIIFFVYNLLFSLFGEWKCIGMIIMKLKYKENYSRQQLILYNILYTLSFSTLLFYIYYPFDLFIFNMMFLQLPTIIIKKTTLHWYISGNVTTVSI